MFINNVVIAVPATGTQRKQVHSRNIPEPMKRVIRQRCGFGCVVCGQIIYDYDHMLNDWAEVKEHIATDITLLCPDHHREKTNGLLTKDQVAEANMQPYNLRTDTSRPHLLHFSGDTAVVVIANNVFTNHSLIQSGMHLPYVIPILIDGVPIIGFRFQDQSLLLNINFFNQYNEPIFCVIDNQLIFKPDTWDVDLRGSTLKIREQARKVLLELEFCPPNKIVVVKAVIRFSGVRLVLEKDHFVLNGKKSNIFSGNAVSSLIGLSIGMTGQFPMGIIHEQQIDRYGKN